MKWKMKKREMIRKELYRLKIFSKIKKRRKKNLKIKRVAIILFKELPSK